MALVTDLSQPNADAYVSISEAQEYCSALGLAFDGADAVLEAAIRRASQYLNVAYRWKGVKASIQQSMAWPRIGGDSALFAWEGPAGRAVRAACCELAYRALSQPLMQDADPQFNISVTVGPISKTMAAPSNRGQKRFVICDSLLNAYIDSDSIRIGRS